jgi:hypothetical protein
MLVIPPLAYWGALFVRLKWVACPVAAAILMSEGRPGQAVLALLWPAVAALLPIILAPLGAPRIGDIEKLFMNCLGYRFGE